MHEKKFMRFGATLGMTAALATGLAITARAEPVADIMVPEATGTVIIPSSSIARPEDAGKRAHTNTRIFIPAGVHTNASQPSGKYETPASLACVYGLTKAVKGCNPSTLTTVAPTGSKMVAIVDAFDYPTATNDLTVYSNYFGLPAITKDNFQVVYASGKKPKQDSTGGWELEEALDIEMAHAMAPGATVILVEADSNSYKDLLAAEAVAAKMVTAAGGGEVSNSWSGSEGKSEKSKEKDFVSDNVVFLASAGDSSGIGQPAALQNVIAVGGTLINRDSKYNYINQTAWSSTGGGSSAYIKTPKYQKPVKDIVGATRGTPDISLVASPSTGVWMYDTTPYNGSVRDWLVIGGTSVSSPALAGLLNSAGSFAASTVAELTTVYKDFTKTSEWTDITGGSCGNNGHQINAVPGWDFCTGVGVPNGLKGK
jgi:kumamolisin